MGITKMVLRGVIAMVMVAITCATDPMFTPILMMKDNECKVRGSGYLPPKDASSLDSVAKWAQSACDGQAFSWSEENWDKGGAFCCESSYDQGNANPTWNIYRLPQCGFDKDWIVPCTEACDKRGGVQNMGCSYGRDKDGGMKHKGPVCAYCTCMDRSDMMSSMKIHCTDSTCKYPDGNPVCPKQSTSSNSSFALAGVLV